MNVASNLAGLINKNNPAHSQNIPPYGRACMSAGSSIPLPLVWCRFTLSCPAEFAPGGLRHAGRLVSDLSEQIYLTESTSSSSSAAAAAGLATSFDLCPLRRQLSNQAFSLSFILFFSTVSCERCAIMCHGFFVLCLMPCRTSKRSKMHMCGFRLWLLVRAAMRKFYSLEMS